MGIAIISKADIIDAEDVQAQVAITDNTANQIVLSLTTKNALRPFLAFCGQAWDVTLDTYTTWRCKVNGITIYRLWDSKVQIAQPEQSDKELVPWIELPQQAKLTLEMDVSGAGANGNGTGRFKIYYARIESGLYVPRY